MSRPALTTIRFLLLAGLALVLCFWIADIGGDFPINDDWAYALPVRWLVRAGVLRFTDWQYMTLIGQTLIGGAWGLLFGTSFTALRFLTAIIGLAGLTAYFRLNRRVIGDPGWAAAIGLAMFFGPLFLPNVASFMTDIWCWAFMVAAIDRLYAGLDREAGRRWQFAAGWALAIGALLIRQVALAIPIGFIAADLARNGMSRHVLLRGGVPLLAMLAICAVYAPLLDATIGAPAMLGDPSRQLGAVLADLAHLRLGALRPLARGIGDGGLYFGLIALPIMLGLFWSGHVRRDHAVGLAALLLAAVAAFGTPIPLPGNVLQPWGIGPRTLVGQVVPGQVGPGWWAVTALACLSAAVALLGLATAPRRAMVRGWSPWMRAHWREAGLIVGAGACYAPLIIIYGPWLDRHVLLGGSLLLTAIAALLVRERPSSPTPVAVALVGLTMIVGTLLLHDYFAWQHARWSAAAALPADPRRIDAGFEYDALALQPDDPRALLPPHPLRWRDPGAACVLTEDAAPPFAREVARVAVARWLPLGGRAIVASCRSPG